MAAEQAAGTVATAVIGGITDRAVTTVMRKLRSRSGPPAAHEKLQRLETLVLKLRCAVEMSEKHAIGSASLLEWRDRLRDAAAEGGAVVLDFQRRARAREAGEAASTSTAVQQQPPTAAGALYLYFTRSALSGMAQRVRDATRRLFSTDEDMKKLDGALEKIQRFSPDITQFLMALQLEVSMELVQRAAKRKASPPPPPPAERIQRKRDYKPNASNPLLVPIVMRKKKLTMRKEMISPSRWWAVESGSSDRVTLCDSEHISRKAVTSSEITPASAEEAEDRDREAMMLAKVLEPSLKLLESFIKETDGRDMGGFEWLAEWAALLRETVERGNAVLQTLCRPASDVVHKAGGSLDLEEDGELYSFARAVEWLARYRPCFAVLVELYALGN